MSIYEYKGYRSTKKSDVCNHFSVDQQVVRKLEKEGMSFNEALHKAIELKGADYGIVKKDKILFHAKSRNINEELPVTVEGRTYNSLKDIADQFKLTEITVEVFSKNYETIHDFILECQSKDIINDPKRLKIYTSQRYNLSMETVEEYLAENSNDIELVLAKIELMLFEYNGEELLPCKEHLAKYNITGQTDLNKLKKLMLETNTKEYKNSTAKNYIEGLNPKPDLKLKLKTSSLFAK